MNAVHIPSWSRWLPKTIATRLYLILFGGLSLAHGLSFALLFYERYEAATSMLASNVEQDVVVAVSLLDHLPAGDRATWLPMLRRRTFHYGLGPGQRGGALQTQRSREFADTISSALGPRYPIVVNAVPGSPERFQAHLQLHDGSPMYIEMQPSVMPLAKWLPWIFAVQMALLLLCTWFAVHLATRPLERLATAADTLRPDGDGNLLPEGGPAEVAKAISAFNAMQERIARYTRERLQILASISHDLQTPITRMKLRAEAMQGVPEQGRLLEDLDQMQHLVREGIAYARSAHGAGEPVARIDLTAFLDSLVCDYQDTGHDVVLSGRFDAPLATRPHALRRVVANLIDNALKYGGSRAEVSIAVENGHVRVAVRDHGPGIPEEELARVLEPFYRLEASRNRDTGGTGLGLAIAQQLADSLGATLQLRNHPQGGLEASLRLPAAAMRTVM